jgi:hypothetical protein
MEFEKWLEAQGWTKDEFDALDEKKQQAMRASHKLGTQPQAPAPPPVPAAPAPAAPQAAQAAASHGDIDAEIAELKRQETIERMAVEAIRASGRQVEVAERIRDLAATASADRNYDVKRFEMELLRASRSQGGFRPANIEGHVLNERVLEAAALMSTLHVSGDSLLRSHGEQAVEAADRRFRGNLGLHELILLCAQANGHPVQRMRVTDGNWQELVAWGVTDPRIRAAGHSTVDLGGILGNVANKALAAAAADPVWVVPRISGMASHTNFYAHTIYSLAMNGDVEEVGPSGELKNVNLSQESWTRQVGTRGAILNLSRTHIINDDLSVFTKNAQALTRKCYTAREKAGFTLLNATGAGSSHFTAARGNYLSGTAFGSAGMDLAVAAFRGLTGPDGDPVGVEPAVVLVPKGSESAANRLLKPGGALIATVLLDESTPQLDANANVYEGRFGGRALTSPYMDLASITGYSTTAWYLLADPNVYPCMEVAYLNGQQTPTVTYFGLDTNPAQLGITWQVFFDFGVALAEWRAGVKSAGA